MEISISKTLKVKKSKKKDKKKKASYKALPVKKKPRKQSGVIPYRVRNGYVEVVLVSTTHAAKWGIPKGGLEPDMSKKESAANEAFEEAGLHGKVKKKIGSYTYRKGSTGRMQTVDVYAMKVKKELDHWMESHRRTRKWFTVDQARAKLHSRFSPMLDKVEKLALPK